MLERPGLTIAQAQPVKSAGVGVALGATYKQGTLLDAAGKPGSVRCIHPSLLRRRRVLQEP